MPRTTGDRGICRECATGHCKVLEISAVVKFVRGRRIGAKSMACAHYMSLPPVPSIATARRKENPMRG